MTPDHRAPPGSRAVTDLMQRHVVTISPDASVFELARLLWREGVRGVPVVEPDGRVIGMASGSDLLWLCDRFLGPPAPPGVPDTAPAAPPRTVREVMTPDVFGVGPDATVGDLCQFFIRTGVGRALVLEGDSLVGLVSLSDVLGLIAETADE